MAATPNTNATSYLTAAEFLKRKDWRTVADFCSDSGSKAASSQSALEADANLAAALADSAGMLESAILAGNRYQPADIAALIATSGVGRNLVYRIQADLTMGLLIERRPDKKVPVSPSFERALEWLGLLRSGERIFSFTETQDAGVLDHEIETAEVVTDRNLTAVQAERFFARRGNRRGR